MSACSWLLRPPNRWGASSNRSYAEILTNRPNLSYRTKVPAAGFWHGVPTKVCSAPSLPVSNVGHFSTPLRERGMAGNLYLHATNSARSQLRPSIPALKTMAPSATCTPWPACDGRHSRLALHAPRHDGAPLIAEDPGFPACRVSYLTRPYLSLVPVGKPSGEAHDA